MEISFESRMLQFSVFSLILFVLVKSLQPEVPSSNLNMCQIPICQKEKKGAFIVTVSSLS